MHVECYLFNFRCSYTGYRIGEPGY